MTTVPSRNGTLGKTIASLRRQLVKADEIRLYLTPGCEPIDGVRCLEVEDRGPVTKLSAVTDESLHPDTLVITVDDDVEYQPGWLRKLVLSAKRYPNDALGMSGWNARGFIADPVNGTYAWAMRVGSCDVLEGCGGVAYRRRFFEPDVMNPPAEFRFVDDVWISSYLARRKIKRRLVGLKMSHSRSHDGLSYRSDFVELNRRAAILGFG